MIVLGIETSCDETAAALVREDGAILSNQIFSQIATHECFGGVVPELAARAHLSHLDGMISGALREAGIGFSEISGVAATSGPGLIGGVMVGMMAGKAIAAARGLPFVAVNHLEAHALTARMTDGVAFPYMLLLVSGGHTQILAVEGVGRYRRLGGTLDDAAGEAFDKVAKLMGLPYPGGPNLERTARACANPEAARARFPLPHPLQGRPGCDFSFSGLKTAIRSHVVAFDDALGETDRADLAFAFQERVAEVLADRVGRALAMADLPFSAVVVAGGVAANGTIRTRLQDVCARAGISFVAPPVGLCSDNAAMVAWAGVERLRLGLSDPLDVPARPRWPLDQMRMEGD